jgi:hypothetical protein
MGPYAIRIDRYLDVMGPHAIRIDCAIKEALVTFERGTR